MNSKKSTQIQDAIDAVWVSMAGRSRAAWTPEAVEKLDILTAELVAIRAARKAR